MLGIKFEGVLVFRGVTFGLAARGDSLAIASSKLFIIGKKNLTYPHSKCVCEWEGGLVASDGI